MVDVPVTDGVIPALDGAATATTYDDKADGDTDDEDGDRHSGEELGGPGDLLGPARRLRRSPNRISCGSVRILTLCHLDVRSESDCDPISRCPRTWRRTLWPVPRPMAATPRGRTSGEAPAR